MPKNKCPYCGGQMVIEYIGSYGSVYPMKRDGNPQKKRIRRILYEENNEGCMVYCWDCRKMREES